jgi:hypothetical protein
LIVSYRRLVFVTGLALGDYLLWNWSLNSNHEAIALIAGLTLPVLAFAALWMLVLAIARRIAQAALRPGARQSAHRPAPARAESAQGLGALAMEEPSSAPPRKIAA